MGASRSTIACGLVLAGGAVQGAEVASAPATFELRIERQPLDSALKQLATQCGLQVIFFSRVTEGLSAPAVEGERTLKQAMEDLLAGSGLTFRVINPQTVEIRPAQARAPDYSRDQNRVAANLERVSTRAPGREPAEGALEEVVVVGLAEQLVATRIATPLREIPQAVSIVSREQIRLQNSTDLSGVLSHAPGFTMSRNNSLVTEFYSRGFRVDSLHVDGGAGLTTRFNSSETILTAPDLSEFDHVEILRGADALFSGDAKPGGTVSLVRKRPQRNFALEFNTLAADDDGYRVEVDVTGPISNDGALRGRADAVYDREGYSYDVARSERKKIFGALEYDLSEASTLTAGLSYQWDDSTPVMNALPFYQDGTDSRLPRDLALAADWARYETRVGEVYLQYRQGLSGDWALKVNAAGWRTEAEYAYAQFDGAPNLIDPVTNQLGAAPSGAATLRPNIHSQFTGDATITGTLNWFGWREEVAIGADFTRLKARADVDLYSLLGPPVGDVTRFDPSAYPRTGLPWIGVDGTVRDESQGIFASLRVYFDAEWSVMAGARINDQNGSSTATLRVGEVTASVSSALENEQAVTPYAAIMYSLGEHYSIYASYADINGLRGFERLTSGSFIFPASAVSAEAGIKGEWRGGALNGSAVIYRVEHHPQRLSPADGASDCCQAFFNTSRGVDLELSGEVMPGWQLGAGYTFNESKTPQGTTLSTITPKHLLKAWTNFRLPGEYRRWELGGSLHAQSATESRVVCVADPCPAFEFVQDPYAVLDLRAGFEIDANWRISLSADNVFDKIYYESIGSPPLHGWYGAPRSWSLRVDGRY